MKSGLLFLLLFATGGQAMAQTPVIESLKQQLAKANTLPEEERLLTELCGQRYSLSTPSLQNYTQRLVTLLTAKGGHRNQAKADYYRAAFLVKTGGLDSAQKLIAPHLAPVQGWTNEPQWRIKFHLLQAMFLTRTDRYQEAIAENFKTLRLAEETGDVLNQINAKGMIGWAYMEMKQNREAIAWFTKAIHTTTDTSYFIKYPLNHSNLAAIYTSMGRLDSAEHYIKQALGYTRLQQNLQGTANALAIQSDIY